jgi:hypothetical protein
MPLPRRFLLISATAFFVLCSCVILLAQTPSEPRFFKCVGQGASYEAIVDLHTRTITIQWRDGTVSIDRVERSNDGEIYSGSLDERGSQFCKQCRKGTGCFSRCANKYRVRLFAGLTSKIAFLYSNGSTRRDACHIF